MYSPGCFSHPRGFQGLRSRRRQCIGTFFRSVEKFTSKVSLRLVSSFYTLGSFGNTSGTKSLTKYLSINLLNLNWNTIVIRQKGQWLKGACRQFTSCWALLYSTASFQIYRRPAMWCLLIFSLSLASKLFIFTNLPKNTSIDIWQLVFNNWIIYSSCYYCSIETGKAAIKPKEQK